MFNSPFDRPVMVLLSAMWALAAVLAIAAFVVSASASVKASAGPAVAQETQTQVARVKNVESVTGSPMLREPGLAISKDKLD